MTRSKNKPLKSYIITLLILGPLVLFLDFLWHRFFTLETGVSVINFYYFLVKLIIVAIIAIFISRIKNLKVWMILVSGVIFTLALSVYYRFFELFGNIPFGFIAGDISFGNILITASDKLLFPLIWLLGHSIVFIIPMFILLVIRRIIRF